MAKETPAKELGASGVFISGGMITGEEYNSALSGQLALRAYDQMRRNDATVNAALMAVKQPILNADFQLDPASDKKKDKNNAEFIDDCLMHIIDWEQFLGEALTFLEFGFVVFEQVYEPRIANGQLRQVLTKLAFRKQTTIVAWETEDHQPGVTQALPEGKRISIPLNRLVIITHKQEGENYEGISILRTAYKHWKIKDQLYKIDAVGHENHALGILDITKPKGATTADEAKMRQFAMNRRANAQSFILKPEDWTVEFMDMKSNTLRDIMPSVNHHDRQIMKNVLAQFLEMGASGAAGSRATSEDHSRLFELAVQAVTRRIVHVLQNTMVRNLIDLNFTNAEYPTLRVAKISDDNIPVVSEAIGKFVTAGALHPQAGDENVIRNMLGWPELEPQVLDDIYAAKDEVTKTDDEKDQDADKPGKGTEAAVGAELRALRASVEKALYDQPIAAA